MSLEECASMATFFTKDRLDAITEDDEDSEEEKVDLNTLLMDVKDPKIF